MKNPTLSSTPYRPVFAPNALPAHPAAIVNGPHVRFTVLTSRLIRMEHSPADVFEDCPSQVFWYRRQPVPEFTVDYGHGSIEIETEHLRLVYRLNPTGFTPQDLWIELREVGQVWHYGDTDALNLKGTCRTLDRADGPVPMNQGLMSRFGWSLIDDSDSFVFDAQGWLARRAAPENLDLYFFGYGYDYPACLQDFCRLSGQVPLIPRWTLGNWWSRYWAYSQAELLGVMDEFQQHQVPLSVCIIDMDWHVTDTGNGCTGWTGYTWNRTLFPDPAGLLADLHRRGLKVGLNLHPAEGIHPHEEAYSEMCGCLNIDPAEAQPIPFDLADPAFAQAYFETLHHPMEKQGVDFWWLDWQQGVKVRHSARPDLVDLDPLWWLNHLHFYDLSRDGSRRPFVFSRWAGLGSRYAIGFSGDAVVSWKSLAFQPYFTATAANVAFPWWSHDIGGHMFGTEDPELYTRWVQLGVFSPILRLHCTNNPYHERRPWGHDAETCRVASDAMRLRHALIPYLYTMAWRTATESLPLVLPMYYLHPGDEAAYHCPNQYYFGSQLLAAPYVTPAATDTKLSCQHVWLPEGDWYDFLSGERYVGGGWRTFYGALDDIPLLARSGGIVPLGPTSGDNGAANPADLTLMVFPGSDNRFDLYEDDGESQAHLTGACCLTHIEQTWEGNRLILRIDPADGDRSVVPAQRRYKLCFRGIICPETADLSVNGEPRQGTVHYDQGTETYALGGIDVRWGDQVEVVLSTVAPSLLSVQDRRPTQFRRLLKAFRLKSAVKLELDRALPDLLCGHSDLRHYATSLTPGQLQALQEVLK